MSEFTAATVVQVKELVRPPEEAGAGGTFVRARLGGVARRAVLELGQAVLEVARGYGSLASE